MRTKLKTFVKHGAVYVCIVVGTLAVGEILARALFPPFAINEEHWKVSSTHQISKGKHIYLTQYRGLTIRNDFRPKRQDEGSRNVFVFGDSVTRGYGLQYQNTYYAIAERLLNKSTPDKYHFYAHASYGQNLKDSLASLLESGFKFKAGDYLIYQFNYNDLLYSRESRGDQEPETSRELLRSIRHRTKEFRAKYLNRSALLRVMQHYAGILTSSTSGACEARGLDALRPYTYAFGAKGFEAEAHIRWKKFENELEQLIAYAKGRNVALAVLISPIALQIAHHEKLNHLNLDLSCATIEPRARLTAFLQARQIPIIDPTDAFNEYSMNAVKENNPEPLYHKYDLNHVNVLGSQLMAEELLAYFHHIR